MRVRRTESLAPSGVDYVETMTYAPYSGSGSYSCDQSFSGSTKEVHDEIHPGFAIRRSRGEIVMGNFDLNTWDRTYTYGHVGYRTNSRSYSSSFDGDIISFVPSSFVANTSLAADLGHMSAVALVKATAKIRDSQVLSGEVLATMAQTVGMLRRPFDGARKLLKKIRKAAKHNRKIHPLHGAQAEASAWLEYAYGWKPLILDCNQVMKNVESQRTRLFKRRLVTRSSQHGSRTSTHDFSDEQLRLPLSIWRASGTVVTNNKVSAHAGVLCEIENSTIAQQLGRDFCLGADALPQVAWEVIPGSFVADWFVGVGEWLAAVTPIPGVKQLGNWVTTKDESTATCSGQLHCRKGTGFTESGTLGTSTITQVGVHRRVNQSLPSLPMMNLHLNSLSHAVSGVSLLLTSINRDLGRFRR